MKAYAEGSFPGIWLSWWKEPHHHDEEPKEIRYRGFSSAMSTTTYYTAVSSMSTSTYYSARESILDPSISFHDEVKREKVTEYHKLLISHKLWPVDPKDEKNWSGKGQHVIFNAHEKFKIDKLLQPLGILGSSSAAIVERVQCKRIPLARKTIRCRGKLNKTQAIREVQNIHQCNHSHVVQVIGTYVIGNELAILMYPATEYNLETFIYDLDPDCHAPEEWQQRMIALGSFFGCLSDAVMYLHGLVCKHMDIKPQNILVRDVRNSKVPHATAFKVYIADFGIARSYTNLEDVETEGPTMFTRKYAAPEVVDMEKRGLAADVFSLGCVFVEIAACLSKPEHLLVPPVDDLGGKISIVDWDPFGKLREVIDTNEYGQTSYQANIGAVSRYVESLEAKSVVGHLGMPLMRHFIPQMIAENPRDRPTSLTVASFFADTGPCCSAKADVLEAETKESDRNSV